MRELYVIVHYTEIYKSNMKNYQSLIVVMEQYIVYCDDRDTPSCDNYIVT